MFAKLKNHIYNVILKDCFNSCESKFALFSPSSPKYKLKPVIYDRHQPNVKISLSKNCKID